MYLEKINGPEDVKKLKEEELQPLADEVRKAVINRVSKIGGHKGPNLGVVEMTVALHYVFNSPVDKIVFDVSHQCYPHKILTGRKEAYLDDDKFSEATGYTNPLESKHDFFKVGHTSTSVSLCLGLAVARDLRHTKENIIAVIGDGSLSGGEALEALDYAGEYKNNLIIIVNDNDQSIAENHGGLYKNLKKLRMMNGVSNNNFFKALGFEYHYLDDGHDIKKLVDLFNSVKDTDHPVLLHIHTIKGKGLKYAEENREAWHSGGPFNIEDGSLKNPVVKDDTVFNSLKELLDTNSKAVVLIGSLLGFLVFNTHPAKVFMGDTGSLALGGSLAAIAILTRHELSLAVVGGVFVIETLSSLIQIISIRKFHKKIFKMAPLHHHFEKLGWEENDIVKMFWIIGLILAMLMITYNVWL